MKFRQDFPKMQRSHERRLKTTKTLDPIQLPDHCGPKNSVF